MTDTPFDPFAALHKLDPSLAIPAPVEIATKTRTPIGIYITTEGGAGEPYYDYEDLKERLIHEGYHPERVGEMLSELRQHQAAPAPEPAPVKGINPKDALGLAKVDLSVVPPSSMLHLASAMMDGAVKYGPFNWRDSAVIGRVYVAAAMRHLLQYLDGETVDPTSGVQHLGHAMACCAILLDAAETGNLDDNRPHSGVAGDMIRRWSKDTKFGS